MKKSTIFLTLFLVLIAVLVIILLENYFQSFFLAPIIESVIIFLVVFFIRWISDESLFSITVLVVVFFFSFETIVYLISAQLGFLESPMYEVFSWRIVYGLFFTFIWIPITVFGLRYKEKVMWFLFLFIGCLVHLIINLVMYNF